MKIERIETYRRDDRVTLVKVYTDDGIEGLGQTSVFRAGLTAQVLHEMVAPAFLGSDPWDLEAIVADVVRRHYKFAGSFLTRALTGLDTAVWDVLGKATGQPVHKLLGGCYRSEIGMYASSMSRTITPSDEADRLAAIVAEQGFAGVKIRIGQEMGRDHDASPGRTEAIIPQLRSALGDDVIIHADANGAFTPGRAIRVGRMLEDQGYGHFEEPCPYAETDNIRRVNAALDIPVAGGEHDTSMEQIYRMVAGRAVDIIQPDIGYLGGVSRARRVAALAETAGIPCTPHCSSRSMIQIFTLHLAAAMPSVFQLQEWSIEPDPQMEGIYAPLPQVRNGAVRIDDRPGWGVELDPAFEKQATLMTGGKIISEAA
ncbi:L-alanine-DL-glutamate epimerase [Microlunatus soli]|uniref:L-alanine-DL-glutamate epimerase n=2 Tax=Microlunatus soli TaxID=630515 RepID=A0A1H1QM10_9ACTN|nr:L-alanine-DL-glutamate epimerase [Microlunatus soli]